MDVNVTSMAGGRPLPPPSVMNGAPATEVPCVRPSCGAVKRQMLALAQRVDALREEAARLVAAREALRTALDERSSAVDWTPLGGERVMRSLTPTEARVCEALLLAGREASPDDGHDEPPTGEFKTARYRGILRHTWGQEGGIGDDAADRHLIRVNASRLRHKLRPFGWDVVAVFGVGMRLAPWTGERIPLPPERPGLGSQRISDGERAQIASLWEGGYRLSYIGTVTGRSSDTIRRVLRGARLAVATTPDTERWVGVNRE